MLPGFFCLDENNKVIQIQPEFNSDPSGSKNATIYKQTDYGEEF